MLVVVAGCGRGGDGVALEKVSGSVQLAGTPIEEGEIRFVAADGSRTDAGAIKAGQFQLQTTAGKKRVEVYAVRSDPKNMVESAVEPGKMEPSTEMYIPEKYNAASTLEADVAAGVKNVFEFPLDS